MTFYCHCCEIALLKSLNVTEIKRRWVAMSNLSKCVAPNSIRPESLSLWNQLRRWKLGAVWNIRPVLEIWAGQTEIEQKGVGPNETRIDAIAPRTHIKYRVIRNTDVCLFDIITYEWRVKIAWLFIRAVAHNSSASLGSLPFATRAKMIETD